MNSAVDNISIFYYGGTGGFFALHLIMLSKYYNCVWKSDTQDWHKIFDQQWNIQSSELWKKQETWPDNELTKTSTYPRKIYFYINPTREIFDSAVGSRVVIFTDRETQWAQEISKRCFHFCNTNPTEYADYSFTQAYNSIKSDNWPNICRISDYHLLPDTIKDEIENIFNMGWIKSVDSVLDEAKNNFLPGVMYQGIDIFRAYKDDIDISQADVNFTQQELVITRGKCLYDALHIPWEQQCANFTEHYLNLHPEKLKQRLILKLR